MTFPTICQHNVGIGFGYSIYKGDLSQPGIFGDISQAGMAFNVYHKYQLFKSVRLRTALFVGQINGNDARSSAEAQRRRNLNFKNNLMEFSLAGEYNFSNDYIGSSPLSFFVLGGLGIYHSNPTTTYNGYELELRPLNTENQSSSYSLYHPVILAGGGAEYEFNDAISLTVELIGRVSNNDYLDDVSGFYPGYSDILRDQGQLSAFIYDRRDEFLGFAEGTTEIAGNGNIRGNPNSRDYYMSVMFNFLIRLNATDYQGKNRKRIICPSAR